MADIFLSYASKDRRRAANLAKALEGLGWSVFWDIDVPAGLTWDKYIGFELEKARCVVVVWSKAAVESDWVTEEAREGREKKILVPAFFAKVRPPFGFRGIQGPDLTAWRSSSKAPAFQALVKGIERILGPAPEALVTKSPPPAAKKKAVAALRPAVTGKGAPSWAAEDKLNRYILIQGGEFLMGSAGGTGDERDQPHRRNVPPFYLQEHPVTNLEYARLQRRHKFPAGTEKHPVVNVSSLDALGYTRWLGGRLPTEAEWEYACRAGTETLFWSGDSEEDLARVGWYEGNSGGHSHPVAEKPANPWGLYDMHGNVWEWVADSFRPYPGGSWEALVEEDERAIRGGSFKTNWKGANSARRAFEKRRERFEDLGFRVAFDAAPSEDE